MPRPIQIKDGLRKCPICKIEKPIDDFSKLSGKRSHLYDSFCKPCRREYENKRRKGNKQHRESENKRRNEKRATDKKWKNNDNASQRERYHRLKNNPEYKEKRKQSYKKYVSENREKIRVRDAEKRRLIRVEFINAYGGKCECCGEHRFEFLTLEHVNGGGRQERKKKATERILYDLKKQGWKRDGKYKLLCTNCNHARGSYGYCPHERE